MRSRSRVPSTIRISPWSSRTRALLKAQSCQLISQRPCRTSQNPMTSLYGRGGESQTSKALQHTGSLVRRNENGIKTRRTRDQIPRKSIERKHRTRKQIMQIPLRPRSRPSTNRPPLYTYLSHPYVNDILLRASAPNTFLR